MNWFVVRVPRTSLSVRLDRRVPLVVAVGGLLVFAAIVLSVGYGEYNVGPLDVVRVLLGLESGDANQDLVVRSFRLPRALVALMVGMALATSGAIAQAITANDLADPGILGVNAGAGVAAVGYLVFASEPKAELLPWLAFLGAMTASTLVYTMSWRGGLSPRRLILIGVGVASFGAAIVNFLITRLAVEEAQGALSWLTGSVYGATWYDVRLIAIWLVVLLPLALLSARQLNPLMLAEASAVGLGQRVNFYRGLFVVISAALASIAVVVAGTVGFVGFVAPHIARRFVGPSNEGVIAASIPIGGLLMLLADLFARWAVAPNGLPVGAATALMGAPYFAFLLYRKAG